MTAAPKKRKAKAKAPAKRGPRTKCTPANIKKIADIVRAGNYVSVACASVNVTEAAYYKWVQKGEAGIKPYVDLVDAVRGAESDAERELVRMARESAAERKDSRAALEILARRHPARWSPKTKHEHTGADGGAIEVDASAIRERVQADILRIIENASD